ncbi:MAG: magnetochrome domain-containing protein [Candidatus Omnitrophica bacterium]|nr:magnetochrome domain-containing protein [Candidatus Omnitrophota bacterium]
MVKTPQKLVKITLDDIKARFQSADLNTIFIFGAIILILIVGVYALFSSEAQNAARGNPACGKIVIAANGRSLASTVAPTLPEARYFLVVNPLSKKLLEVIKNPYLGQQPNTQLTYLIAGKGEEAVIVGSVDQQTYNVLLQFGIRVFGGYQGRAQKVISLYRQARISAAPLPNNPAQAPGAMAPGMPPCIGPNCPMVSNMMPQGIPADVGMQNMRAQGQGMNMNQVPCPLPGQMPQGGMNQGMPMGAPVQQGMGMNQVPCPLPARVQGGMLQGGAGAGFGQGMQNAQGMNYGMQIMNQPNCLVPNQMQQVGLFNWGQQAFVCPTCNWRMKAARQGNAFPPCPNCGGQMALDMYNPNKIVNPFVEAPEVPAQQANFFSPNPDMMGTFQCPNCNWLMHSQQGANEFPRCPNCGQIMKRTASAARVALAQNGGAMNAAPGPAGLGNAPPIFRDAAMLHQFRGVCENCHVVNPDITIPANASLPHNYRGVCSNCHQIAPTAGAVNNANAMPNNQFPNYQAQVNQAQNNAAQDPNVAHMAIK